MNYHELLNGQNNDNYYLNNNYEENLDIISLLKNNPNINLYLHKIDYLSFEELSNMFSYILNNIISFASNPQSFLLINKIISLYNPNLSSQNEEKDNNVNEYIYSFLLSFLKKKNFFSYSF